MALLCPSVTRDSSVGSSQPAPCEEVVSGRLRPRAPAVVNQLSLDTGRRVIFMLICPDCIIDMLHLLYFFLPDNRLHTSNSTNYLILGFV